MNRIALRDEILQMLYWMRGEKIGERVSPEQLNRFLRVDAGELESALRRLVMDGLVIDDGGAYGLTTHGIGEGARRFADEFSGVLGKEDHLTCSDPECDCHAPGWNGVCHSGSLQG